MVEVDVAVVGPQAAVVEAQNIVEPVGITGNARGLLVRRRAPVVGSVGGAAPGGVPGQHQSAGAVVAALLPRAEAGTARRRRKTFRSAPNRIRTHRFSSSPGPDASDAVNAPRVVRAHAAVVQVTAVIRLKAGRRSSTSELHVSVWNPQ